MKYIYLLSIMATVCLTACSKEDDITPHDSEENVFLNTYGSSTSDIALQNAFFDKNGIYVLFNDTLRKTQIGLDADGKPYYDVKSVDIGYGMNSSINSNTEKINFNYLTSDVDKKEGVNFVNEMILPSLGKALRPFSFLLVNKINYYVNSYGTLRLSNPVVYSGWRCTAFALPGVGSMTDAKKKTTRNTILQAIVVNAINSLDQSLFTKFYSYCDQYYSTYAMYDKAEAFIALHPTMYDLGFLSAYSYGKPYGFYIYNFKAKSYDLQDYTSALFAMTESEFMAKYGQYPIVVEKYKILRKIVEGLGVVF